MIHPVECSGCGAPVPLATTSPVPCRHCGAPVHLPSEHVALAASLARGEDELRAADALWKTLPSPRSPRAARLIGFGMCAVVLVCTFVWAFVLLPRFGRPGFSMVFFVLVPSLVAMQLGLEWLACGSPYARLEQSITASVDPRFPEVVLCRHCGAPLTLHEHALFARCAYCGAHNLVRHPKPAAYRYVSQVARVGKEQLAEAIAAVRMIFLQRRIVRWVGVGASLCIVGVLAFALRNT